MIDQTANIERHDDHHLAMFYRFQLVFSLYSDEVVSGVKESRVSCVKYLAWSNIVLFVFPSHFVVSSDEEVEVPPELGVGCVLIKLKYRKPLPTFTMTHNTHNK